MNRLNQKCFVASTGVHVLLFVILLIGPAFLSPKSKPDSRPPLDVIPGKLIDAAFSGGGDPHAAPPPPAPPEPPAAPAQPKQIVTPPAPKPEPVKAREPEPSPEDQKEVKSTAPDPNALEPSTDRKRRRLDVPTTPVIRKRDTGKAARSATATDSTDDSEQRQVADRNRRLASAFGASARSLRDDLAPGTSVGEYGSGGGGPAYAGYADAVRSIYWHAWTPPDDTASDAAVTRVTVTIASDGTVLSARITKPSGDDKVDKSVQRTLDRVRYIAPFPEGAKDKQRTYNIKFDLKAKRLTG